jgi:biopolymer transport protein ExbB
MLALGVEHLREPRELIEEVMYERVLTTRLQLNRMLPFIAICAASAPLLGLLGTVTGIIDTFKMMTVFGSGDVKALSGGISKALITTEYGLIVAIPSLLLHAFLSRKARAIVGSMETAALAFANQAQKSPFGRRQRVALRDEVLVPSAPDPDRVRTHVNEILKDLLGSLLDEDQRAAEPARAGAQPRQAAS